MSKRFDYQQFEEELEVLLGRGVIEEWEGFGPGHYRINGKLDIWPRNKRYFHLPTAEHGQYKECEEFVTLVL